MVSGLRKLLSTHSSSQWAPVAALQPVAWLPVTAAELPGSVLAWLAEPGSLTQRLRAEPGALTLHCLYQGAAPESDGWQRQVLLLKAGRPWVWALTQASASTLNQHPELAQQGERPLGDWLFGAAAARRDSLLYADLAQQVALVEALQRWRLPLPTRLWARHSRFALPQGSCSITELFLPDSPLYAGVEDEVSACKR